MELGATVSKINIERTPQKKVTGVTLKDGRTFSANVVISNADYVHTFKNLIDKEHRPLKPDWLLNRMKQSMSLVVIYFGFKATGLNLQLKHHNIILGPRYEALLKEIFEDGIVGKDFSQYLHIPTLTDPSLAPPGHHAAYTLVPVPNKQHSINWDIQGPVLVDRVLRFLEDRGYIPDLANRLVHKSFITPDYFQNTLLSHLGNGFGLEPRLTQSAYFRPHNRVSAIKGLYLVGANSQPGGGTPSVMMSAKMTARAVAKDYGLLDVRDQTGLDS